MFNFQLVIFTIVFASLVLAEASWTPERYKVEPYVVGGRDALPGQFPHFASLRITGDESLGEFALTHAAGGAILNRRWILTV